MASSSTSQQKIKWQKLDHETELIFSDEAIARDAKLLETLRKLVRGNILTSNRSQRPKIAPLLLSKYRGNGFPLNGIGNLVVPRWRDLSPWFKVQLGLMVLAEGDFVHFKIGLHDQLLEELKAEGKDIKIYLRDRMARCLRSRFGRIPFYFFVFEDRDDSGMFEVPPTRSRIDPTVKKRAPSYEAWRRQISFSEDRIAAWIATRRTCSR